jgi:hypothetical protein
MKQAELLVDPVDGDVTFVRNVRKLVPGYSMCHKSVSLTALRASNPIAVLCGDGLPRLLLYIEDGSSSFLRNVGGLDAERKHFV